MSYSASLSYFHSSSSVYRFLLMPSVGKALLLLWPNLGQLFRLLTDDCLNCSTTSVSAYVSMSQTAAMLLHAMVATFFYSRSCTAASMIIVLMSLKPSLLITHSAA